MNSGLRSCAALSVGAFWLVGAAAANAAVVDSFGAGGWDRTDVREGGTAEIVDVAGEGGALENDAPLGTGVARLTTGADNDDKAEIGIGGDFGTVGDFIRSGSLSYDYFKGSVGDLNGSAAAAIKFTVFDASIDTPGTTDGFATFVYEPTWNLGAVGTSVATPTDQWLTGTITGDSGVLWHTSIYGDPNKAGDGSDGRSFSDWNAFFNGDLLDAFIVGISIGVGTFNQGQTAYVDNVQFVNLDQVESYDFEAMAVPVPAALPLFIAGLGAFGLFSRRKNAQTQKA